MALKRINKVVTEDGSTITYEVPGTTLTIESRKKHIPHANGIGTWDHTTYFVIDEYGAELAEKYSLKDAVIFAAQVKELWS